MTNVVDTFGLTERRRVLMLEQQAGMTLLEVLVVIVIAAILASMVVVTWSPDPIKDQLKSTTDTFSFKLEYGFEEAMMRSIDLGIFVYEDGYSWAQWVVDIPDQAANERVGSAEQAFAVGRWVLMPSIKPWRAEYFEDGYRLTAESGQPPASVVLKPRPKKTEPNQPELDALVLPMMAHGETYPSTFTLTHIDSGRFLAVDISEFGEVSLVNKQEKL